MIFNTLLIIQDVAEPQTIKMTSLRAEAKLFQKYSNAVMKFERGVSIQGISSMKTTFFSASDCSINCSNIEKPLSNLWANEPLGIRSSVATP